MKLSLVSTKIGFVGVLTLDGGKKQIGKNKGFKNSSF